MGSMRTPIGETPENWEVTALTKIGKIVTGTTPSTKIPEYWGDGYPFVTPSDFSGSKYVSVTARSVTEKGAAKGRLIPEDSVMVVCIASVGEVALTARPSLTNQQINSIVCNDSAIPSYIYYVMVHMKPVLKRWAGTTTTPIVKKSLFEQFQIPLPPLPEQKKIAEILSTVDEAIQKVDEAIANAERLKKGLMQKLLTKGIGHKEFVFNRELRREIPKEWGAVPLTKIAKVITGTTPSTSNAAYWVAGDILWITPTDLSRMTSGLYIEDTERKVTIRALKECNLKVLPERAIVVSTRAPVGYVMILAKQATINQGCKGLVFLTPTSLVPEFYLYYLRHNRRLLERLSAGSTFRELAKAKLGGITVPVPPLPEQRKIAEILSTVDKKLELERARKAKLERLKKGLMNVLLTGKVRVKV